MTKRRTNPKTTMLLTGRLFTTPGALNAISMPAMANALARHQAGDWGDLCDDDRRANDDALRVGNRILSAYHDNGTKFWIITEADRSITTVLLPSEY